MGHRDPMDGSVELAVSGPAEPVPGLFVDHTGKGAVSLCRA